MKVPTFHKFGLTKAQIEKSEIRDQKISDILTHHLTIGIGIVFGLVIYVFYYIKVKPDTFLQIIMQVFLFASLGIICVGIPAVLFKLGEMAYFKYFKERTQEHKTIQEYYEQREEFDFWKVRKDYSFWKYLDGLSFEKEIINMYLHLGYELKEDFYYEENPYDRILTNDGKSYYFSFITKLAEVSETDIIDKLLKLRTVNNCQRVSFFSQSGFHKKVSEYANGKEIVLFDINAVIKVVRTIKN